MGIKKSVHLRRSRNGGSFGRPRRCSSVKAAARIDFPSPPRVSCPVREFLFENCGRPASRLVADQNLSPRHLLLFMRRLLRSKVFSKYVSCFFVQTGGGRVSMYVRRYSELRNSWKTG